MEAPTRWRCLVGGRVYSKAIAQKTFGSCSPRCQQKNAPTLPNPGHTGLPRLLPWNRCAYLHHWSLIGSDAPSPCPCLGQNVPSGPSSLAPRLYCSRSMHAGLLGPAFPLGPFGLGRDSLKPFYKKKAPKLVLWSYIVAILWIGPFSKYPISCRCPLGVGPCKLEKTARKRADQRSSKNRYRADTFWEKKK